MPKGFFRHLALILSSDVRALGGARGLEAVYQRMRSEMIMTMRLAGEASIL
jgi:hypothetical protein